jgi:hypothetical protein
MAITRIEPTAVRSVPRQQHTEYCIMDLDHEGPCNGIQHAIGCGRDDSHEGRCMRRIPGTSGWEPIPPPAEEIKADGKDYKMTDKSHPAHDPINAPSHYTFAGEMYEPISVIEAWELGYNLGCSVKYIARAGRKTKDRLTDLKKARWYLDREIQNEEKK